MAIKWQKQIIQIEHNIVKNSDWLETNQNLRENICASLKLLGEVASLPYTFHVGVIVIKGDCTDTLI